MKYEVVTLFFQVSVFVVYAERGGHLNDHCQMRDECSEVGYFCSRNFTCQCLTPFYIPNWNRRQCVGAIDQKCKYDEHCIEGAFCFQQRMCQCKDDFFPSVDKTMCLSDSAGRVPVLSTLLLLPLVLLMGLG